MEKQEIINLLKDEGFKDADVEKFSAYCIRNKHESWMKNKTSEDMAILFRRVASTGLVLDGENVTIQSTGISYNYVAYKNLMLIKYPETIMDISLVYEGDTFDFGKENGKVIYKHEIKNPFDRKDDKVVGGYCVIKNKRGEFLTILNKADFEKHKKTAKMKAIWNEWFPEMCFKTLAKKSCKQYFADIFQEVEEMDNENYDPKKVTNDDWVEEIENLKTLDELKTYWEKNKGKGVDFAKAITLKKQQLQNENS